MLYYLILALVFAFVMELLGLAVFGKFLFWLVMFFDFVLLLLLKLQIELNGIHRRFARLKPREVALYTLFNHGKKQKQKNTDAKKRKM